MGPVTKETKQVRVDIKAIVYLFSSPGVAEGLCVCAYYYYYYYISLCVVSLGSLQMS
jgi:hypothetical protein